MEIINHECYVSLEVAELLKKAGFNWYGGSYRYNDALKLSYNIPGRTYGGDYHCIAPTLEVAQRWLREVKNISVDISSTCYSQYEYIIRKINQSGCGDSSILALTACKFYTYEEAQEAGIKKALEIILEKGE